MFNITCSREAYLYFKHLGSLEVEEFWVVGVHANRKLVGGERVFRGTVDACPVYARDIFRFACRKNASAIILAHNHPSGDNRPSAEDIRVTQKLKEASRLMGIPLLDHLIIAGENYWSFADSGLL
ncbi:MAG: JAB domain-containing protein [Bdellovibrionales bacterium]|nr:JAB domain-containing protein [Bdellovibrionales bacterium]